MRIPAIHPTTKSTGLEKKSREKRGGLFFFEEFNEFLETRIEGLLLILDYVAL
jgi:hypothetical protein